MPSFLSRLKLVTLQTSDSIPKLLSISFALIDSFKIEPEPKSLINGFLEGSNLYIPLIIPSSAPFGIGGCS